MSRLQTSPIGLLGALDMKVGGDNPRDFGEQLAPTFDTTPFYLARTLQLSQASIALTTPVIAGDQVLLTVPNGEAWYVYAAAATLALFAGDVIQDGFSMYVGYRFPATTSNDMPLAVGPPCVARTLIAELEVRAAICFPQGLLLQSGSSLIARTCGGATVAATAPLVCAALYARVIT